MGPTYYMRLKHMVKDKINFRARGPNQQLTRQPVQGRANDGGLRIGEMERDAVCAHGLAYFLNESFLIRGDEYYMAVCNKTGAISIYNESRNLFLSPYADGPLNFYTNNDGTMSIKNLTKYGRSFSILRIPYSFKLLIQELQIMNIQMRLITDDNIDQLMSMSYSNNISKLLKKPEDQSKEQMEQMIKNMVLSINTKEKMVPPHSQIDETPVIQTPEDISAQEKVSDIKEDNENVNEKEESPQFKLDNSNSPQFKLSSEKYANADSPPYAPSPSPALDNKYANAESPDYAPSPSSGNKYANAESPDYAPDFDKISPIEIQVKPSILDIPVETKDNNDNNDDNNNNNNNNELKKDEGMSGESEKMDSDSGIRKINI